jgi:hypothetical protein
MDSLSRLPLYLQVKNYITSMIDSGDYPADSKLPTEKELMKPSAWAGRPFAPRSPSSSMTVGYTSATESALSSALTSGCPRSSR